MIKTHSCNAFFVFYKIIVICYYNSVVRNCYNKGDNIMTRKQALEDLFLAVKRHLLNSGRNLTTSIMIAEKVMHEAKDESIEDIKKLRDVFIG